MSTQSPIKLKIPRQDKPVFELFTPTAAGAEAWAAALPVTNTRLVVKELRQAIDELNRVDMAPDQRFVILEILRPSLHVALTSLSRRFLNQPLVLPEEPRQMWESADKLYSLAITAYTLVAVHTIQRRNELAEINPARQVCESIQRALHFCGRRLLQTFQLYQPVELHGWLTLHQLYALAERQQLARLPVADPISGDSSIATTYLQGLMLGACKPNQLRQSDLAGIYRGLREWADMIALGGPELEDSLFIVDLDSDQPPVYASFYGDSAGPQCRHVDTRDLIAHLETLHQDLSRRNQHSYAFDRDTSIPSNLLEHLVNALGSMSMRNFTRSASSDTLSVAFGLNGAHYHIGGERGFAYLLHGDNYVPPASERLASNPFLTPQPHRDMWQQANPEEDQPEGEAESGEDEDAHNIEVDEATMAVFDDDEHEPDPEADGDRYPVHQVTMINASPGGYCLEWNAELPSDIRTGDLVSIRESNSQVWVLAVLRWISQLQDERTLVGVELLSPRAMAYGARVYRKFEAASDPVRVLLLPEIKLVGQPHTLVAPRVGLSKGQKLVLIRRDEEFYVELLRQVTATASFVQFDFRYIKVLDEDAGEDAAEGYDSLWSKL